MTESEMRNWIDNAPYRQLLEKWRHARIGDPFFSDVMGKYFRDVMSKKGNYDRYLTVPGKSA